MMKFWSQVPLFRPIMPFLSGILCACYFSFSLPEWLFALLFILLSAFVLTSFFSMNYKTSWLFGILMNLLFFVSAYDLCSYRENECKGILSEYEAVLVHARLSASCIEKKASLKAIADLKTVKRNGKWEAGSGRVIIYFEKNEKAFDLKYGDEIIFYAKLKEIEAPKNPEEFNYKDFLSFQGIQSQTYLKTPDWKTLGKNSGNRLITSSISLRDYLLERMKALSIEDNEFAVGAALLLGYSDKLDQETIASYSATGALHVLSVSGLHVAIVYIVFNWILGFLERFRSGLILKAILLILLLWMYAALTGLSPSVLRAATMFSFIVIAKSFKWRTNIYNTLAASAFLLLLIDPFLLMQVGFQLSYIAVIGIVFLQPKIHALCGTGNWFWEQMWSVTSVSIAAQIATFPLGLYYFHQFPNYFLISNLVVIPISTIIIYLGIAFFIFSRLAFLATFLATGFSWSVWFLNSSVKKIEELPWSVTENISVSIPETILIYICILLICFFFIYRKYNFLFTFFLLTIFLLGIQIAEQFEQAHQRKVFIYNIPKATVIDLVSQQNNFIICRNKENKILNRYMEQNWWKIGVKETRAVSNDTTGSSFFIKDELIIFAGNKLLLLDNADKVKGKHASTRLKLDQLLISGDIKIRIEEIRRMYDVGQIIFDSSNSKWRIEQWKRECEKTGQAFYSIPDQGAFVIASF